MQGPKYVVGLLVKLDLALNCMMERMHPQVAGLAILRTERLDSDDLFLPTIQGSRCCQTLQLLNNYLCDPLPHIEEMEKPHCFCLKTESRVQPEVLVSQWLPSLGQVPVGLKYKKH